MADSTDSSGTSSEPQSQVQTAAPSATPLDPEVAARIASLRIHVRESFGKVVIAMMPRYRHQALADLQHLVLEPLIRDRIAIAQRNGENGLVDDTAGRAIWASVSDEADARIRDQAKGGNWPLRLRAEDWNSGSNNWLIDAIAPDPKGPASVITNFRQVEKEGSLKLHPLITRLLDEETLKRLGSQRADAAAAPEPDLPEPNVAAPATVN